MSERRFAIKRDLAFLTQRCTAQMVIVYEGGLFRCDAHFVTDSNFIQDIAFLSEAIKATIYRDRGFTHPFQNLIELIANVTYDEDGKKHHVDMDMDLIRELSEDFTEDDDPEKA